MGEKQSMKKHRREHRESAGKNGGGGKVYHEEMVTQKYKHVDEKGVTHDRTRVVPVNRRGLSDGDKILIRGPRGFQPLGQGHRTRRAEKIKTKSTRLNAEKESRRARREEKRDG